MAELPAMRIVVFGANGPTGRLVVAQLADAGRDAVAVTRQPDTFPTRQPDIFPTRAGDTAAGRVDVVQADVFQRPSVAAALDGADAVVSVLGVPFTRKSVETFSTGTANIVAEMRAAALRRLVVVSSTGAHHYRNRRQASWSLKIFEPIISSTIGKTVYRDMRRMEEIVEDSGLDWTIVRPSTLFDAACVSNYVAGVVPPVGAFTSRIDLAHYLSTLIADATSIGTRPIVSTTDGAPTFLQNMKQQASQSR